MCETSEKIRMQLVYSGRFFLLFFPDYFTPSRTSVRRAPEEAYRKTRKVCAKVAVRAAIGGLRLHQWLVKLKGEEYEGAKEATPMNTKFAYRREGVQRVRLYLFGTGGGVVGSENGPLVLIYVYIYIFSRDTKVAWQM